MNILFNVLSSTTQGVLVNKGNVATLDYISHATHWSLMLSQESEVGLELINTAIEAYAGNYQLSALELALRDKEVVFSSLLNACCAAYALYLNGYISASDIYDDCGYGNDRMRDTIEPFLTQQFTVPEDLLKWSTAWYNDNTPF